MKASAEANAWPTDGHKQQSHGQEKEPSLKDKFIKWWLIESPNHGKEGDKSEGKTKLGPLVSRLMSLMQPDGWLILGACVFMVCAALAELTVPHFATKCIFTAAKEGANVASYSGYLKLLSGIIIVYGITSALRGYCFSIINNRMTMRLRSQLFHSLVMREVAFFDSTEVGTLTSRLQSDTQAMTKCIATNLNIAARNMLQAVGGVVYLAVLSPTMCIATLAVCVLLWAITLAYGAYARRTQRVLLDTLAAGNQVAEEVLSLSRIVRTFGTESHEGARYGNWLSRLYAVGLRQATGYGLFVATGHIACYMTKVVALFLGCHLVLQGALTAEQLTNYIFYVEFVTYASLSACDEVVEVAEALGASERVMAFLDAKPAPQVASGRTLTEFKGHMELKDVSFRYPSRPNNIALSNVSLRFEPGNLVALVGLSGSGKTTLVALLQRLYDPDEGIVLVDGTDLREIDAGWYRAQIGVVSQEPRLFSMSVADNIAYGCPRPVTRAEVEDAASQANAYHFCRSLPHGFDTVVTDRLLSGGQKQRIALARALVRRPKFLILDEATSALDAESEAQVQGALDAAMAARDRTVIVIAHRLSTVRNADVTVVMDKGSVAEIGTHDSLVQQGGLYHNLVARQQYGSDTIPDSVSSAPSSNALSAVASSAAAVGAAVGAASSSSDAGTSATSAAGLGHVQDMKFDGLSTLEERTDDEEEFPGQTEQFEAAMAAAASITAENDIASKSLGSTDPIDYNAGS